MAKGLKPGDSIQSTFMDYSRHMIKVVKTEEGLVGFRARCGKLYLHENLLALSRGLNYRVTNDLPFENFACVAQQLLAEGLCEGKEWK